MKTIIKKTIEILLVSGILFMLFACEKDKVSDMSDVKRIAVNVEPLELKPFVIYYNSIGRIESENKTNLFFESSGKVKNIYVFEGDHVEKGQSLAKLEMDIYEKVFIQSESVYEKAQQDLISSESLYKSKIISSDQLDKARIRLDNATALFIQAKNALENTTLKAPYSGWIVGQNLNIGDLTAVSMASQNPPFILANMEKLKVNISVPEARIGTIEDGMLVKLTFKTFPGRTINGKVSRIGLATKNLSNYYNVEIALIGDVGNIKLGMVADVRIVLQSIDNVLVLPLEIIRDDGNSQFIFKVINGIAHQVEIQIEAISGSNVLVNGELNIGDSIIIRGQHDVSHGENLEIMK